MGAFHGPLQMDKALQEVARMIEKMNKVAKCLFLKVAGRGFTDGGAITIESKECKVFEQIIDHFETPLIQNDVSSDKDLAKDLQRLLNIKVHNLMLLPVILKR